MKSQDEVISEFNELVNMTASELEKWLKSDDSNSAGWPKDTEDGESVGHDSGRKIVDILKSNPKKDAKKYTEDQITHMRKVVSYCKRHLAQEGKANAEKPEEEVKKTKSYASLKNWGHDPLKARQGEGKGDDADAKDDDQEDDKKQDKGKQEEEEEVSEEDGDNEDEHAGDKRKASDGQAGANKKRELRNRKGASTKDDEGDEDDKAEEDDEEEEEEEEGKDAKSGKSQSNGKKQKQSKDSEGTENGKTTDSAPEKGDKVSWNWGGGQPEGKVLDVKPEKTSIQTKNGNEVSRDGSKEDPAVVLDAGKSKAIKLNHELN